MKFHPLSTIIVSVAMGLCTFAYTGDAAAKVRAGDRAAELSGVKDGKGKTVKLKKFRGSIVVLTFGASWCKPCGKELPKYEKLSKKYKKSDVVFIAVNIDKSIAKGKKFNAKAGLKNVVAVYDPRSASVDSYDPPTMPSTFIIDRKGVVRSVHAGFESGDDKHVEKLIAKYK